MRGVVGALALVAGVASVARADVGLPTPVPAGELAGCGHEVTGPCYRPAPCTTGADCGGEGLMCTSWHVCTAHVDGREWLVGSCPPEEHCGTWDVEQQMAREWYLGPIPDADISCSDGLYCVPEPSLSGRPAPGPAVTRPSSCGCRAGRGSGSAWWVSISCLWLIARRRRARPLALRRRSPGGDPSTRTQRVDVGEVHRERVGGARAERERGARRGGREHEISARIRARAHGPHFDQGNCVD